VNLVEALLERPTVERVVCLDRVPFPWSHPKLQMEQVNARSQPDLLKRLEGVDLVFHLAADSNVDRIAADPSSAVANNVGLTGMLLDASRRAGVSRFLLASSTWVYMGSNEPVLTESVPLLPLGPGNLYAATKLCCELLCRAYQEQFDLATTVLRFSTPYGPHMRPELVVLKFVRQAMAGEPITIAGRGEQTRNFIYVGDLVEALIRAAMHPIAVGRTYNLSGLRPVSIRELAEAVRQVVPGAPPIRYVDGRSCDFVGRFESSELAQKELGWVPATDIVEGVRRLYEWSCATERRLERTA
jgi:UDP-glucose 4-epimerase